VATVTAIRDINKVLELLRWFEKRNDRSALLFRLGINTALRIGDLLDIKYTHVFDPAGRFREYLHLNENKTGKERKVKLNDKIRPHIKKYCEFYEMVGEDYLFFSNDDPNNHMHRVTAWRALKAGADACGIEHFGTHTLRKTAGYHIYQKSGNDIALVMTLLNHSNPKVTLRYIGASQQEVDKALQEFGI